MGIKLNGIDLESTYGFDLANVEGLEAPRIRQNTAVIPGIHGELDFGGTYETRNLYLVGTVRGSTHAASLTALQQFIQSTAVLPLRAANAPLDGAPLSPDSVLSTLELPDFTDRYFGVAYNGTFEAEWLGARQVGKKVRVRIGFRQPKPWASAKEPSKAFGVTSGLNQHVASNDGGIAVPPRITIAGGSASSFSIYNQGVDPFNTITITGTIAGSPAFQEEVGGNWINGALQFANGTDKITYPLANNFSLRYGSIELLYVPTSAPGVSDAALWTLYNSATDFWLLWYDSAADKFKFRMKTASTDTTITSTKGISALAAAHYLVVSWTDTQAYLAVNGESRVNVAKNIIAAMPSTIRIGSSGDDTLSAKGYIDEFIVWNRDVGNEYQQGVWNGSRYKRAFGRPVPGVLLYADFNFSKDAVGCGQKIFTYSNAGNPIDANDVLYIDMEKQTAFFWDNSGGTKTNVISAVSNHFFDLMPGINTMSLPFTGTSLLISIHFQKRYLL